MQKRDQSKVAGTSGGAATPAPKRGRPFGTTGSAAAAAAAAAAADSAAPSTLLGPSLQVHSSFAGQSPTNPRSSSYQRLSSPELDTVFVQGLRLDVP